MASLSKFIRAALLIFLLGAAIVVAPLKILDNNGIKRVERLQKELDALDETNAQLRRENDALSREIRAFHTDPLYIEKVARDELGMIGVEEVIYQFPSVSP